MKDRLLLIQPLVPHYRLPFFDRISEMFKMRILYGRIDYSFNIEKRAYIKKVKRLNIGSVEFFFILTDLIKFKPKYVITYGEVKQLTNILLILVKKIFKYKLVIWSHGFQNKKMTIVDKVRLLEMRYCDGILFYTQDCYNHAKQYKLKNAYYLNNTIDIDEIKKNISKTSRNKLKEKYNIKTDINGIFISRFTTTKNPDLLIEILKKTHEKNKQIGFIIIGEGACKPDFSKYNFIYDFGELFDLHKKSELFKIADFSIMPSGIGLSIVECFANKIPMFTLANKFNNINHGVEYCYLRNNINGYIAADINNLIDKISNISPDELLLLGNNADLIVSKHLNMKCMVIKFFKFIKSL